MPHNIISGNTRALFLTCQIGIVTHSFCDGRPETCFVGSAIWRRDCVTVRPRKAVIVAKSCRRLGETGAGQLCKMVNQICIAGVLNGLSEGLVLAEKSGLDIPTLVDCLKNGAAGSWQMENRATTMAQDKFDFGFAIDWMIKDLGFCLDEAERQGIQLPLTEKTNNAYKALSAEGQGRMDTSVLMKAVVEETKK